MLELSLQLLVVHIHALETLDTATDLGREGLDVAGRLTHERREAVLDHVRERGIRQQSRGGIRRLALLFLLANRADGRTRELLALDRRIR